MFRVTITRNNTVTPSLQETVAESPEILLVSYNASLVTTTLLIDPSIRISCMIVSQNNSFSPELEFMHRGSAAGTRRFPIEPPNAVWVCALATAVWTALRNTNMS